jgi:UDP-glucuronate 4-epimerase
MAAACPDKEDTMTILVTGAAGFLGYHASNRLLAEGYRVFGIDNLNSYYDPKLKADRLALLHRHSEFRFEKLELADRDAVTKLFQLVQPQQVLHLGAQAGVRYSLQAPHAYVDSNLVGFVNVLEGCRQNGVSHLVYASSSSVYGASSQTPYSTREAADRPVSLYAATKRSNELLAHAYAHLFGCAMTGLRFFTVYGPWGRPDMAPSLFAHAILEGRAIHLFNYGEMRRDFTYVDDVVEALTRILGTAPSRAYRVYNVGATLPVALSEFLHLMERCLGRRAERILAPMQPGDVVETSADVSEFARDFGFRPDTPLERGLQAFCDWYRTYHGYQAGPAFSTAALTASLAAPEMR